MKKDTPQQQQPAKPNTDATKVPRPEIRDNLDSRSGEEQSDKGQYTTHNKKDRKNDNKEKQNPEGN